MSHARKETCFDDHETVVFSWMFLFCKVALLFFCKVTLLANVFFLNCKKCDIWTSGVHKGQGSHVYGLTSFKEHPLYWQLAKLKRKSSLFSRFYVKSGNLGTRLSRNALYIWAYMPAETSFPVWAPLCQFCLIAKCSFQR